MRSNVRVIMMLDKGEGNGIMMCMMMRWMQMRGKGNNAVHDDEQMRGKGSNALYDDEVDECEGGQCTRMMMRWI